MVHLPEMTRISLGIMKVQDYVQLETDRYTYFSYALCMVFAPLQRIAMPVLQQAICNQVLPAFKVRLAYLA